MTEVRITLGIPDKCNMEPRCPYCVIRLGNRDIEARKWIEGLEWLRGVIEIHDVSVCLGEPMADAGVIELMREVELGFTITTNLVAEEERYLALPDRVKIVSSFHPEYWRWNIDRFLDKWERIRDGRGAMGMIQLCAWPPYYPMWKRWREKVLKRTGAPMFLIPFVGYYEGRPYPDSYSTEQAVDVWGAVRNYTGRDGRARNEARRPKGRLCAAGMKYLYVHRDGTILRCHHYSTDDMKMGHLFERQLYVYKQPTLCYKEACECPDLWTLQE